LKIVDECGLLRAKRVDLLIEEHHKLGLAKGQVLADPIDIIDSLVV